MPKISFPIDDLSADFRSKTFLKLQRIEQFKRGQMCMIDASILASSNCPLRMEMVAENKRWNKGSICFRLYENTVKTTQARAKNSGRNKFSFMINIIIDHIFRTSYIYVVFSLKKC